jgi:tetratricopeptide (TPR) repeat protein
MDRWDLVAAIVEAEELLDEEPENVEALQVVGDAEIELGHGREARLAFERLLEREPDRIEYLCGLAVAHFLGADFEPCLETARKALVLDPRSGEAHAFAGLCLERLGQDTQAAHHLKKAARLAPEHFPLAIPEERVPWARVLKRALERLPLRIQDFYHAVPVVYQRFPDVAALHSVDPPLNPLVLALYEGEPPDEDVEEPPLPRSVRVFKGNAARFAHDLDRLVKDLALALESEACDWLNLPMEDEGQETDPEVDALF